MIIKNFGGSLSFKVNAVRHVLPGARSTTPLRRQRRSAVRNPFWASNLPFLRYFRLARRWRRAGARPPFGAQRLQRLL